MKKVVTRTTETYSYDKSFYVDITETIKTYEAYIYHVDYGVKMLMFAVEKVAIVNRENFMLTVESQIPDFIKEYKNEHMAE